MAINLDYDSSRLNNREKMLICNYKGVLTEVNQRAFAELLGIDYDDILWLTTTSLVKIREKLKKEIRK